MKDRERFRRLLIDIDECLLDGEQWNDEKKCVEREYFISEEDVYREVMQIEEHRWLGSDRVRAVIHAMMSDFGLRMQMLRSFGAL